MARDNKSPSFFESGPRYPELGNLWQLYKCALTGTAACEKSATSAAIDAMDIAKAAVEVWDAEVERHKREQKEKGREEL